VTVTGVDIEQFMIDPYATGIQRVLQYLAKCWPKDTDAVFIAPFEDGYGLLAPDQAAKLLSLPFHHLEPNQDLRDVVSAFLAELDPQRVDEGALSSEVSHWLLPEVSYLPSVLTRFAGMADKMPTTMIGYDTLPMTEPGNYRFVPGNAAWVSEYFRRLATSNNVVCISDYAKDSIMQRLRRDPALPITVAYPGGDHLPVRTGEPPARPRFARLGTMEARKWPLQIVNGFVAALDSGFEADLLLLGNKSASDERINARIHDVIDQGYPVRWIQGAGDAEVHDEINTSTYVLSFGVEGYGIPVLESIRMGTPVLYAGTQPAGEVMEGKGAKFVAVDDEAQVASVLKDAVNADSLREIRFALNPNEVPSWGEFAEAVAQAGGSVRDAKALI
jgi:glycosyltransferase involved in cell wall biosynthesis